ncbi:NAD(P)-binding protein [Mycobacterium sp. 852002-51152_SCH6134967]|uniref:NAD(P)-binding protein n=1 Tax=Mycobacterium sp. 852002-51152_SCH6134967 TaxID=1834096 RepID=UPI0012E74AFC|nr:NAD(P)-binding protein [Mycobacterium sp. 852002-51152_SCH6134967]
MNVRERLRQLRHKLGDLHSAQTLSMNSPQQVLDSFRLVPDRALYQVGAFETGVTVYSQQVRALNLAWSLIESDTLISDPDEDPKGRIAIIGAGFAGLTLAAALLKKAVAAEIVLFERHDTVLPLQHGCESRWLHPYIYNWPEEGTDANSPGLPLLNWTASRASDVVREVIRSWSDDLKSVAGLDRLRVYCNTRHLQISLADGDEFTLHWVGNRRQPRKPSTPFDTPWPIGESDEFNRVIFTVGFGLEKKPDQSYWRNETFAQAHLGEARATYIVSGSGDSAFIDLLRLRVAHFRQDLILYDLFSKRPALIRRLQRLRGSDSPMTFQGLQLLFAHDADLRSVRDDLWQRLRNDTMVILHLKKNRTFASIFEQESASFQNRLMTFLLYRCGGFIPSNKDMNDLATEYSVPERRIIIRHGTERLEGLNAVLTPKLSEELFTYDKNSLRLTRKLEAFQMRPIQMQAIQIRWPFNYFDEPGRESELSAPEELEGSEYVPPPLADIADHLCSTVSRLLKPRRGGPRLRVTFFRKVVRDRRQVALQQCCAYHPMVKGRDALIATRRVVRKDIGILGAAYAHRATVRSKAGVSQELLREELQRLRAPSSLRDKPNQVRSLAAMPLLSFSPPYSEAAPGVLGILYMDSFEEDLFANDTLMRAVHSMCDAFLTTIDSMSDETDGLLQNPEFLGGDIEPSSDAPRPLPTWDALEPVGGAPPSSETIGHLNVDARAL